MPEPRAALDESLRATIPDRWARQVAELGRLLAQARADIAALPANGRDARCSFNAHDELDAIALQTSSATHTILDACEVIDPLAAAMDGSVAAQMQAATTRIYEACGFHDLVGQRITRVLATLQTIDAALATMLGDCGMTAAVETDATALVDRGARRLGLVSGPQSPRVAMRQEDVDRLMAGD